MTSLELSPETPPSTPAPFAANLPKSPRPSAPVRPEIVFAWEPFSLVFRESFPLLRRLYEELGSNREIAPLDPDWKRYFEYERAGMLRVWTARANGVLVGFANCLVTNSLLCETTLCGYVEHYYILPEWRMGSAGRDILRTVAAALAALGARIVQVQTNDAYEPDEHGRSRVGALLRRDGFSPIGTVYEKVISHERRSKPSL